MNNPTNLPKVSRPRLEYLDVYRAFAIFAVIMIHVTSFPMVQLESGTWQQFFYYFLNSSSNFAVPSFLFLSGLVLFYNYFHRTNEGYGWIVQFYKKRLLYILIPYILWSLFYFVFLQVASGANPAAHLDVYFSKLLIGKNYTHLYYFMIIMQFYVLFPFILKITRASVIRTWIIPLAILIQLAFFLANLHVLHIRQTGILFITYFLHFCTGAYIGIHYERAIQTLQRRSWLFTAIFVAGLLLYVFSGKLYYQWIPALLPYKSYLNFTIYYWFTVSAGAFLLLLSKWIHHSGWLSGLQRVLQPIGAGSFAIFLVHPFFLALWRQFVVEKHGAYYHYLHLGGFVVALVCSWVFYWILSKMKRWSWVIIGK